MKIALSLIATLLLAQMCKENPGKFWQKEDTEFTLQISKTPCYGKCPIYTLNIDQDGSAHFEGERFTDIKGTHDTVLSKADMDTLKTRLSEADFHNLDSLYYDEMTTDLPSTVFTLKAPKADYRKRVEAINEIPTGFTGAILRRNRELVGGLWFEV